MTDSENLKGKQIQQTLRKNLTQIEERIQNACNRSGRSSHEVTLVAVTKYADWTWVEKLAILHDQFGENRPQQLVDRRQQLPEIHWHLIGQLQRNKARSVLTSCDLIHSVDSPRLFQKLADLGSELNIRPRILLQVNVSGEQSKSGFQFSEVSSVWQDLIARESDIEVCGFMTMAPANQNLTEARETFRGLRALRESMLEKVESIPASWSLDHLSMGMSGDFEIAIEEGATIIRVGSALFDGLEPPPT